MALRLPIRVVLLQRSVDARRDSLRQLGPVLAGLFEFGTLRHYWLK